MNLITRLAALTVFVVLSGCSSSPANQHDVAVDIENGTPDAVGTDVVLRQDNHVATDVIDLQGTEKDLSSTDAPVLQCAPGEGCFLDSCTDNGDCQSGWCVQHMGENVCSQTCQEECPAGWSCQQVAGTDPDVVYICVSDYANLCRPCTLNSDCTSTGGAEDACVVYGTEGSFCGGPCGDNDSCPWGFSCKEVSTVEGSTLKQCVNDTGECPCTTNAISLGLTTSCTIENDVGSCHGKRTCTDGGLSACDALTPTAEICNGIDDDCDGEVDEPDLVEGNYVNLCNDANDCTEDKCMGAEACVNSVIDSGPCEDGDPCTVADHCDAGTCIGDPVDCDDQDPCTDNVCTETGGCEYPANSAPCDDDNPCTVADQCTEGICTGISMNCECLVDDDCAELEDGDLCNGTLTCDTSALPYKCVVSLDTVVTCPAPEGEDAFCQQAHCDPLTGDCSFIPNHEGFLCGNGNACTVNDTCVAGECSGGGQVNCNDGNPCTEDSCDLVEGCSNSTLANGTPCLEQPGWQCMNGQCQCVGSCEGKVCGTDYCGGSCGDCGPGEDCVDGQCIFTCTGSCDGKVCGDDGCGGSCGDCPEGKTCSAGTCIEKCEPSCEGKDCGPDGCGGQCGICGAGEACINGKCPPPGLECDDGNDIDWDGCTDGKISEFQVNITTAVGQTFPDVAAGADGTYTVVWTNQPSGNGSYDIFGRTFNIDGADATGEKVLSTWGCFYYYSINEHPRISQSLSAGEYAVTWRAESQAVQCPLPYSKPHAVFADWEAPNQPGGNVVIYNGYSYSAWPTVAVSDAGTKLFVWPTPEGKQGAFSGGQKGSGLTFFKIQSGDGWSGEAATCALADGRFVVVWGPVDGNVLAQFVGKNGGKEGGEIGLAVAGWAEPEISCSMDGGFVLVGRETVAETSWIRARRFDSNGDPSGPVFDVGQAEKGANATPVVASLTGGGLALAWKERPNPDTPDDIWLRVLDPQGDFTGDAFVPHLFVAGGQYRARVAASADGGFVLVWQSEGQDGDLSGIFAQRFDASGNKIYK